jgi:hypothetical protein
MSATARELRDRAKSCLELAEATNEYFAKSALVELARDLTRLARQQERREHDLATLPKGRLSAA